MLEPDTVLNDRYRLIEPAGEGGMATVYRATDARLGRTVAIKVLHPQFGRDQPFLQRFQQEAEFAASLGAHPNIVAIYDIAQDGPLHYIVMEYVEGPSLKDLIRQRAPFPVAEAFAIGQQVASALDFAHKRGLVHRDVKPQNIMVTPEGVAKVTDFGIARSASASQLTRTGMVIGTVHYFSPEQAQGQQAEPASDVYSLGVILYEMLTAHLPFDADTPIGVAMQHVHSAPPSPWDYNRDLPARAVATVMRALEKAPKRRYRDAAEFAKALAEGSALAAGDTTVFNPLPEPPRREQTAVFRAVEPAPVRRVTSVVEEPAAVARPVEGPPPNRWRTAWMALGGALLALAIAAASFFATSRIFGSGASPTATPTVTPTVTPKPTPKRRKPTPTATVNAVVLPTYTPVPPPSTATPAPPTFTPVPPTSTPIPQPTATPRPAPTPTTAPLFPTVTPGPPATPTAVG